MSKLWATSEEASDWWRLEALFISNVPTTLLDTSVTRSWMSRVERYSHILSWVLLTHLEPQTERVSKKGDCRDWICPFGSHRWWDTDEKLWFSQSLKVFKHSYPVVLCWASYMTDGVARLASRHTRAGSGFDSLTSWYGKEADLNKKNRIAVSCNVSVSIFRTECSFIMSRFHEHKCFLSFLLHEPPWESPGIPPVSVTQWNVNSLLCHFATCSFSILNVLYVVC